jgi:hypothetical protein
LLPGFGVLHLRALCRCCQPVISFSAISPLGAACNQFNNIVTRAGLASDPLRAIAAEGGDADLLRALLAAQGLRIHAITPGAPSMEDAFMALSG